MAWQENLIVDAAGIADVLRAANRVAVLGIKTERQSSQPAFYVPEFLQRVGLKIVPVPVYYPEVTEILGEPVYRSVAEVPPPGGGSVDDPSSSSPPPPPPHAVNATASATAHRWLFVPTLLFMPVSSLM